MTRSLTVIRFSKLLCGILVLAAAIAYQAVPVVADQIQAFVGAQSADMGRQALAFLPNEVWVHVGDSVTWAFPFDEPHTVTFLASGQVRPPFPVGCPGTSPSPATYPTTPCVNSGILLGGAAYTVQFPTAGNFKLVCLLHANMTGVVHVLGLSETLPHNQAFYNHEAEREAADLLADGARLKGRGIETAARTHHEVTAGIGEIVATGGGSSTMSVMRFLRDRIVVHVGDTVEWTNLDPVTPHTVTFGTEPANPLPPSPGVTGALDGARKAVLGSPGDSTNSGLILAASQDQLFLPQTPLGVTRFRVTFTQPGTFSYICALHDELGMNGQVIVVP